MSKFQKEVDVVFVHKDSSLLYAFSSLASAVDKKADTYQKPQEFLENVSRYPKHTKMILGRTFGNGAPQGVQMAEQLHTLGFTRLYLTSVMVLSSILEELSQIPDYLTFIEASDSDEIQRILNE